MRAVLFMTVLSIAGMPSGVSAAVVAAGPDACAVPAEAAPYRRSDEVETDDLNIWRIVAEETTPTVDIDLALPPAARRVFERYEVDPETGAVFAPPPGEDCDAADESPRR